MDLKASEKNTAQESNITATIVCPACGTDNRGKLCNHCGEQLHPKRITFYNMMHDIPDVFFDIDHGLFYSIRTFLTRPGKEIRNYFAGDRKKHYKPLKFVLLIGGFTAFLFSRFQFSNGNPKTGFEEFGTTWNTLFLLLQLPMIAFFTWLFFKKRKYTFGEHLIANAYLIAEVSLFNIMLFPLYYILDGKPDIIYAFGSYYLSIIIYYSYAFYDWFYQRKGSEGLIVSIVFVFLLFVIIMVVSFFLQAILYYSFTSLGWA